MIKRKLLCILTAPALSLILQRGESAADPYFFLKEKVSKKNFHVGITAAAISNISAR